MDIERALDILRAGAEAEGLSNDDMVAAAIAIGKEVAERASPNRSKAKLDDLFDQMGRSLAKAIGQGEVTVPTGAEFFQPSVGHRLDQILVRGDTDSMNAMPGMHAAVLVPEKVAARLIKSGTALGGPKSMKSLHPDAIQPWGRYIELGVAPVEESVRKSTKSKDAADVIQEQAVEMRKAKDELVRRLGPVEAEIAIAKEAKRRTDWTARILKGG